MATLSYNEILPKKVILWGNEPCLVLSSHVFRKQQRKPVNITKLKGLISGRTIEQTFHQNETAEEAELDKRTVTFVYARDEEYWFHSEDNPSDRFALPDDLVGEQGKFLKEKADVEALVYNEKIIGIKVPIKMDLVVKQADPAVKGNTSSGATKEVVLETGAHINVPMFINEGDVVRVNTETGEYSERVEKA